MKSPLKTADILLPKTDKYKWSVIACDQFTSRPDYWERVKNAVGDCPSSLDVILPEVFLDDAEERIPKIRAKMNEYLEGDFFDEYKSSMIFVERTLPSVKIRRGVVAMVDLDEYPNGLLRPTEQTVPERVPPRAKIRKGAPIELPHVLLFTPSKTAVPTTSNGKLLYDTDLMENGGHIKGYLMTENEAQAFLSAITSVSSDFCLAVGDGNHSLAAAKASGSKYALVETVSIHDEAIVFEPIYRIIKNVDADDFIKYLNGNGGKKITALYGDKTKDVFVDGLAVSYVDKVINEYKTTHENVSVDYIHGKDELIALSKEKNTVGLLFDGIDKDELFPYIEKNGCLPRKAFSMGTAYEKRYYMEAMKII